MADVMDINLISRKRFLLLGRVGRVLESTGVFQGLITNTRLQLELYKYNNNNLSELSAIILYSVPFDCISLHEYGICVQFQFLGIGFVPTMEMIPLHDSESLITADHNSRHDCA